MSLIFESAANLYRGIEGVGGKLILTAEYLLFKPHIINIQKDEEIIYLKDIEHIEESNSFSIIPNGFKVITSSHQKYRFVVKNRNQWIAKINKLRKS